MKCFISYFLKQLQTRLQMCLFEESSLDFQINTQQRRNFGVQLTENLSMSQRENLTRKSILFDLRHVHNRILVYGNSLLDRKGTKIHTDAFSKTLQGHAHLHKCVYYVTVTFTYISLM